MALTAVTVPVAPSISNTVQTVPGALGTVKVYSRPSLRNTFTDAPDCARPVLGLALRLV